MGLQRVCVALAAAIVMSGATGVLAFGGQFVTVGGANADYATIQDAVNAVVAGSVISIHPGTYSENIFLDKVLAILGSGAESTTVKGGIHIASPGGAIVKDLTIKGDGVLIRNSEDVSLISVTIATSWANAVLVSDSSIVRLTKCSILEPRGDPVAVQWRSAVLLDSCTMRLGQNKSIIVGSEGELQMERCSITIAPGFSIVDAGAREIKGSNNVFEVEVPVPFRTLQEAIDALLSVGKPRYEWYRPVIEGTGVVRLPAQPLQESVAIASRPGMKITLEGKSEPRRVGRTWVTSQTELRGIRVTGSGKVEAKNLVVAQAQGPGLFVAGLPELVLEGVIVRESSGDGLRIEGGTVFIRRCTFAGNAGYGIYAAAADLVKECSESKLESNSEGNCFPADLSKCCVSP